MKWHLKLWIYIIGAIVVCFVVIPLGVNFAFGQVTSVDIFVARWEAADALSYIGTTMASLGTFFLGIVAYRQNSDLQKLQNDSFISNNACEVLLDCIRLSSLNQVVCNIDTTHPESIVVEKGLYDKSYNSFILEFCVKRKRGYIAWVRVNSMNMFISNGASTEIISAERYDATFNKIAIAEEYNKFEVTVLLDPATKRKILDYLDGECKLLIDVNLEFVTPNYVSTKMKCRGNFEKTDEDSFDPQFVLDETDPLCFWGGNELYMKDTITERVV